MKTREYGVLGDAFLNATGLGRREVDEDIDFDEVDETEELDEADDEIDDEIDSDEVDDLDEIDPPDLDELEPIEVDGVGDALGDDASDDDENSSSSSDPSDDNDASVSDETTDASAGSAASASVTINPAPRKEGSNMKVYSKKFFDTIGEQAYDAANYKVLAPELEEFILDAIASYPEVRQRASALIADIDYQPPAWGWRYKAVGCLGGKIFNSKAEAENEAVDLINFAGKKFDEIFIKSPYYKGEDGKFTEKVPENSRDYKIITADQGSAPSHEGDAS